MKVEEGIADQAQIAEGLLIALLQSHLLTEDTRVEQEARHLIYGTLLNLGLC